MDESEIIAQQQLIEPAVHRLFRHFFEQRKQASAPYVRDNLKVGRNDPCQRLRHQTQHSQGLDGQDVQF